MKYFNFGHLKEYRTYFVVGLPGSFTIQFNNPKAKAKKEAIKRTIAAMVVNRLFNGNPDRLKGMRDIIPEIKNDNDLADLLSEILVIRRRLLWQYFQCIKWDMRVLLRNCFKFRKAQVE